MMERQPQKRRGYCRSPFVSTVPLVLILLMFTTSCLSRNRKDGSGGGLSFFSTENYGNMPMSRSDKRGRPRSCTGKEVFYETKHISNFSDCVNSSLILPMSPPSDTLQLLDIQDRRPLRNVKFCENVERGQRIIYSDGIPHRPVIHEKSRPMPCVAKYKITIPLSPRYIANVTELAPRGPIGFNMIGLPIYSPIWAVWIDFQTSPYAWAGQSHITMAQWHYHHPSGILGDGDSRTPTGEELVGFAMDGFPIYGALPEKVAERELDECNGRMVQGNYQYHLRYFRKEDMMKPYCSELHGGAATNWRWIMGCFHGDHSKSSIIHQDGEREGVCSGPGKVALKAQLGHLRPRAKKHPLQELEEEEFSLAMREMRKKEVQLERCLRGAAKRVIMPGDRSYHAERQCHNQRRDILAYPLAIVVVTSTSEVQSVVKCVVDAGVYTCARCGSHGFENDACCDGGVLVDMSSLHSLSVRKSTKIVQFESGYTHGQLYYMLSKGSKLVVPGGTESYVGTAGLFLGCGRGLLTSLYGLACDSVRAVEYVDEKGELRNASSEENKDMYWLAKGGGGAFPGIVTSFTVQAYNEPDEVVVTSCRWSGKEGKEFEVIDAWSRVQSKFTKRRRKMFSHVKITAEHTELAVYCFGCHGEEMEFYEKETRELMMHVEPMWKREGHLNGTKCSETRQSWVNFHRSSVLVRNEGMTAMVRDTVKVHSTYTGAVVLDTWELDDSETRKMIHWLKQAEDVLHSNRLSHITFFLYPLGGEAVQSVAPDATAFPWRSSKSVLHYKLLWKPKNDEKEELMKSMNDVLQGLLDKFQSARTFYNYLGKHVEGERERVEWYRGHFGNNLERVQRVREQNDPTGVFGIPSRLPPRLTKNRT